MVAEPWILKMGNQVSNNLKHAFFLDPWKKNKNTRRPDRKDPSAAVLIGILSFEVANVMSKTVHLYKSLTDAEISRLRSEILKSEGVRNVVSDDESYLLELAVAEKLDDLNRVAAVVSRLGKKCTEPALLGFEHIYADICSGKINVRELGFLVKNMDGMVRKMERYVGSTSNLYNELEVLNELEQATKKFQQNQHEESRRAFEQKVIWQSQDVAHLKDVSLWNQTFDKIVGLLARTVCTIYARICFVFGDSVLGLGLGLGHGGEGSAVFVDESRQFSGQILLGRHRTPRTSGPLRQEFSGSIGCNSGLLESTAAERRDMGGKIELSSQRREISSFHHDNFSFPCGSSPGRLFMECLSLSSSALSKLDDECVENEIGSCRSGSSAPNGVKREHAHRSGCLNRVETGIPFSGDQRQYNCSSGRRLQFGPKSKLMMHALPSTIGGSALALHYANVIIVIEKLLRYPHLVGEEARDDLYQMLPLSLRMSLRKNLKSYVKSLAIYDAPLAHDWKEALDKILKWLAPLAHNMIRWQTERNFEQQQIVMRTNVLLLQTLYFADREKTENAICELLVGLNYICRYEHQQNALLDCTSSADFDSCMDWQLQY
ncbi:protein PSK SIMULATOR 1 [Magnolia sinica]|uniref:protein PSK SIMULATOR 1 n=1 Tax=Magnolia sinica TaxID=86752 RepID=UPI002659A9C8|nr:protein PSK SIMULATOR 1 [Magnolia sinica]